MNQTDMLIRRLCNTQTPLGIAAAGEIERLQKELNNERERNLILAGELKILRAMAAVVDAQAEKKSKELQNRRHHDSPIVTELRKGERRNTDVRVDSVFVCPERP